MKKAIAFLLLLSLLLSVETVSFAESSHPFEVTVTANYWGLNTGFGGDSLYTPYLKIDVRNMQEKAASKIKVRVVFYNEAEKKVWSEETDNLIGSFDLPLRSGYSKTSFVRSSVGYRERISIISLPDVSAEIYVNDTLYGIIDIEKTYEEKTISMVLKTAEESDEKAIPAEEPASTENTDLDLTNKNESGNNSQALRAEDIDIDSMSLEELLKLKIRVNDAISALKTKSDSGAEVWYDDNNVKITCVKYGLKMSYSGTVTIVFDFIVENNSDKAIWAGINHDYANGWAVNTSGNFCNNSLAAGKKLKSSQTVYLKDCDIESFDDLSLYEYVLWVDLDEEDWSNGRNEFDRVLTVFPEYEG